MKKFGYIFAPFVLIISSCGYNSSFQAKSSCLAWADKAETYTGLVKAIEKTAQNNDLPEEYFSDTKAVFSRRRCQQEVETKQILGLVTSNREPGEEYIFDTTQRDKELPLRLIDNNIIWSVEKNFRYLK